MGPRILASAETRSRDDSLGRQVRTGRERKYFVKDTSKDFHCAEGFFTASDLRKKDGSALKSSTGRSFHIFAPAFSDLYARISRSAQIIPLKDIGFIIAETGINRHSIVVDAGSGSGALALFMASIAKKVFTYEIRDDFIDIVRKNIGLLGFRNIKVIKADFYSEARERGAELVTLDLPEPWRALDSAASCLKAGGFVASYSPSVPQTGDFCDAVRSDSRFMLVKAVEIIEREWEVEGRKIRPKSRSVIHSGFVSIARLLSKKKG